MRDETVCVKWLRGTVKRS